MSEVKNEIKVKACCLICEHYLFMIKYCPVMREYTNPIAYCNGFEVRKSLLV